MIAEMPNIEKLLAAGELLVVQRHHSGSIHAKIGDGPSSSNALGRHTLHAIENLERYLKDGYLPSDRTPSLQRSAQCSWGCYYSEDGKLVRHAECTVHGASERTSSLSEGATL